MLLKKARNFSKANALIQSGKPKPKPKPKPLQANRPDDKAETAELKSELRGVTEERDIFKKATLDSMGHRNITSSLCAGVLKSKGFLGRVFNRFAI